MSAETTGGRRKVSYKRIATEEAWAPSELLKAYLKMAADKSIDDPGFVALWSRLGSRRQLISRLSDIGEGRIRDMDATGIDMQILSLTSPGVQVFDKATANALAASTNDEVAEAIRKYPIRFAGLAAAAPQDPPAAAKEIERGLGKLGVKGVIINSHTRGELLVLGHGGEALPFWLSRFDFMNRTARPNLRNGAAKLNRKPSEYMKENIYVTTSGMAWSPVITFLQSVLGIERVLYAMDYPYQYELAISVRRFAIGERRI